METFVLLLRGINVGGRNRLPMADLCSLVGGLGATDVRTHLQSGNVVCSAGGPASGLAGSLSAALREQRGLTVPVVVRTARAWSAMVAANPFAAEPDAPGSLHVTFLDGVPGADGVAGLEAASSTFAPDRFAVVGPDVFLHVPGSYADTGLQNAVLERRLGRTATTRNWRTVRALADLAGAG